MYLMHIYGDYILHFVDEATRFNTGKFVGKRVPIEKVWNTIIKCWSFVYPGIAHTIEIYESTQHSDIFGESSAIYAIDVQKSVIELHNSLGIGERYFDPSAKRSSSWAKISRTETRVSYWQFLHRQSMMN